MSYTDVLTPQMPGMGQAGANAAMSGAGSQAVSSGLGDASQSLINQNINPITGAAIKPGFFGQGGMAQIGISAIGTLGSLWNSFQQSKIAKESLELQKTTFETNLKNQTQTYNTALEDRIKTRYASEERAPGEAKQYLKKHSL